jgi:hypothetical protein
MNGTTALPPGVVWLASYPKSGNTWFRVLLANFLEGGDRPQDINDLDLPFQVASHRRLIDDLSLLDSELFRHDEVETLRAMVHDAFAAERSSAMFVKTHDAYTRLNDGTPLLGRRGRAAVCLVRDPRDVAVSYAFHCDFSIAESIAVLGDPNHILTGYRHAQTPQRLLDWSGHVVSWLDQVDIPTHLIRYEDLLADTPGEFGRALAFLGIDADADAVARAARHADFAELQRQEKSADFVERAGSAMFFREGRSGAWRDHLTIDELRAIEDAHGATMARLGYQRETTR